MSDMNTAMVERYRNNFLKEVETNVEEGQWVKMCMQCGVHLLLQLHRALPA